MSVQGNYEGGIQRSNDGVKCTTAATRYTVYSAYGKNETVASFSVANEHTSAVVVTVEFYNGSSYRTIWHKSVSANDTVIVDNLPQRLSSTDSVVATADTNNVVTVSPVIMTSYPAESVKNPV